jgi:hypothetical protein
MWVLLNANHALAIHPAGLLLPAASVVLSLLLIRRLQQRFGIGRMGQRPS